MAEKVPAALKKEWNRIIIEQGERKRHTFYDSYLNTDWQVLFEQKSKENKWTGYTSNYMQVELPANEDLQNKIRWVTFTAIKNATLTGILL
jgi:tRNA A37 methylthiotransferase MiaB